MIRKIIRIDKEKCNGCGACADACHEGAIAMVNGKAKLMREDYCDGLGFNTIDMTADESSQIVAVLKKGESFLENSGASNIADLTFAQKQTLLSYGKEVVGVLGMTMSYDTSSKKLTIYGKDGKVAFSAVPTLTKAGSVQDNSVIKTTGAEADFSGIIAVSAVAFPR